ncbi:hypothetical protein A4X13_0g3183 [Tilletia indica]|uniref:Uncharacterized protein n=1 Tax=Tilletia indica TaxID=43049 RepID=A0A177TXR7_9BASI|nr:hypothetical protein A4X13_0g3183 [Tilletia indica]
MGKPRLRSQTAHTRPPPAPSNPLNPAFTHTQEGPLLILLFHSKPSQWDALARIETFYEGNVDGALGAYLGWEKVGGLGCCGNYMAFNFTVRAVRDWLGVMWEELVRRGVGTDEIVAGVEVKAETAGEGTMEVKEKAKDHGEGLGEGKSDEEGKKAWWDDECSIQERHLLRLLKQLGCLDSLPFGPPSSLPTPSPQGQQPTYLISALHTQSSDLTHERLHALFHLSPTYANFCKTLYNTSLSSKVRAAIEWDLKARGYRSEMYVDEFQAYVSESAAEFGGKARGECLALQGDLRDAQRKAREELGLG